MDKNFIQNRDKIIVEVYEGIIRGISILLWDKVIIYTYLKGVISFNKVYRTPQKIIKIINRKHNFIKILTGVEKDWVTRASFSKGFVYETCFSITILKYLNLTEDQRRAIENSYKQDLRNRMARKPYTGPSQIKLRANNYYGKCKR